MVIIGGGYISLEMAQIFRRLGSQVAIVETGPRLTAREDADVSIAVADMLRAEGIVEGGAGGWLEFDYVPGEWEVRQRGADVGGKLVVIGSKLDEKAIAALFGC